VFNFIGEDEETLKGRIAAVELKILKVRIDERILFDGDCNRVDPDKWRPLIMSFQRFYGLGEEVHESALAAIPEKLYKTSSS
jgi:hypothetical protein